MSLFLFLIDKNIFAIYQKIYLHNNISDPKISHNLRLNFGRFFILNERNNAYGFPDSCLL